MQEVKTFKQAELVLKVNRAYDTTLLNLSAWKPFERVERSPADCGCSRVNGLRRRFDSAAPCIEHHHAPPS